jgi:hypothetical protein
MRKPHIEGLATHDDPESCAASARTQPKRSDEPRLGYFADPPKIRRGPALCSRTMFAIVERATTPLPARSKHVRMTLQGDPVEATGASAAAFRPTETRALGAAAHRAWVDRNAGAAVGECGG